MIASELLESIEALHNELKDINNRLEKIEGKEQKVVKDSVRGSSASYPYIEHNCVVEGVQYMKSKQARYTYKKQLKSKQAKLEKLINKLEYELNYIEEKDCEIRQIIRYKYEDNLNWVQVMFKMGYNSEEKARIKLKRFLEKM